MAATSTFDDLGLPAPLRAAIEARGLTAPTLVQVMTLSPALAGHDLLVSSQTGSGKTLAFGFLIAREAVGEDGTFARAASPSALVVAPTRELAVQVQRELEWLLEKTGARVVSVTGGTDAREEMRKLKRGCDVLVATPGRLIDHLERKNVSLAAIRVAVLDEADEMLDLGFRDDLESILKAAAKERRTHMFSATLPGAILKLAATYQHDAKRLAVGAPGGAKQHQDIEFLSHLFAPGQREAAVVNVLRRHDAPAAIVFTKTRAGAADLATALVRRGFAATGISGDLTQAERTRALTALREGRARVLVATDVAARGLDLPDVALVIHADPPMEASGITHRSGRTGRAGKKGVSVLLSARGEKTKTERLMRLASVQVNWTPLPTAKEIEAADRERLVESLQAEANEPGVDEGALVDLLLKEVPVRNLVSALLRRTSANLPSAVSIVTVAAEPARGADRGRPGADRGRPGADRGRPAFDRGRPGADRGPKPAGERFDRHDRARAPMSGDRPAPGAFAARGERPVRPERKTEAGYVAFRVNVGQDRNAEPRWLLPLICRRGGIDGKDVGSIDIRPRSTTFEIKASVAEAFEQSAFRKDPADPAVRFARELSREELSKFEKPGEPAPRPNAFSATAPAGRRAPPFPPRAPAPAARPAGPTVRAPAPPSRPAAPAARGPHVAKGPAEHAPGAKRAKPHLSKPVPPRLSHRADDKPRHEAKPARPSRATARAPEGYED